MLRARRGRVRATRSMRLWAMVARATTQESGASMSDTSGQIGVAVQGAGTVSTEHLRAYLKNPHCRVVAIGSRTKEGAANKARQVGLDPDEIGIYDTVEDLLAHPGLDALSICTPHTRHAQETIAAAQAGKHVLIEKPVATSLEDLHAMDAAVA